MIVLLNQLKTRIDDLFLGELFEDPTNPSGSIPMVKIGSLDPKRSGQQNDEDFPFVIIRPRTGISAMKELNIVLQVIAGIWTSGDILSGFTSIDRMLEILLNLQAPRAYTPYSMASPVSWYLGDKADGNQPHPYYYLTIDLPFKRAPQAKTRR